MKGLSTRLRFWVLLSMVGAISCSYPGHVQAGLWENIKNGYQTITELPDEVNELKENYDATMMQLKETQQITEDLKKQNEELMAENERQSQQLSAAMNSLVEAEKQKVSRVKKIRIIFYTIASLLVGYFCSIRVLRLILRKRSLNDNKPLRGK